MDVFFNLFVIVVIINVEVCVFLINKEGSFCIILIISKDFFLYFFILFDYSRRFYVFNGFEHL